MWWVINQSHSDKDVKLKCHVFIFNMKLEKNASKIFIYTQVFTVVLHMDKINNNIYML